MKAYSRYTRTSEFSLALCCSQSFSASGSSFSDYALRLGSNTSCPLCSDSHYVAILIDALTPKVYRNEPATWSSVVTVYEGEQHENLNVIASLKVLNSLAFIEGDVVAEKRADEYFSKKKVRKRKVKILRKL